MEQEWGAIPFYNDSGEAVPAGALVEPTGALTVEGTAKARKPTRSNSLAVFVNGRVAVAAGKLGQCRPVAPWSLLRVHPDDLIGPGDTLGSKSGDWYARKGYAGFRPVGAAYSGFVPAVADGGGVTSGMLVAMSTAANAGTQWTTGLVQAYTVTGDLVAANPLETVEMQPLHPTDKLVSGQAYLCVDTGGRGSQNRRRLRAERLGAGGAEGTVTLTVYRYACNAGRLVETPVTITLAGLGLRQVPP